MIPFGLSGLRQVLILIRFLADPPAGELTVLSFRMKRKHNGKMRGGRGTGGGGTLKVSSCITAKAILRTLKS